MISTKSLIILLLACSFGLLQSESVPSDEMVYRGYKNLLVGFAGHFKLSQGYEQQLALEKVEVQSLTNRKLLKLDFDMGKMSIEFMENQDDHSLRSGKILAGGQFSYGLEFDCQVPDSNGLINITASEPLIKRSFVIDCVDEDGDQIGDQIVIESISAMFVSLN